MIKNKPKSFSVVMATYTGVNTIEESLKSILAQKPSGNDYELVLIIDGPNERIREIADTCKNEFIKANIGFKLEQFKSNHGRYAARLAGAKLAKQEYLLIVDDRVELPPDFFRKLSKYNEDVLIPDVSEKPAKNFVSLTLNRMRAKIYGDRWNSNFKPYYIDRQNFDTSAKGTTCLWIKKSLFIKACEEIAHNQKNTKSINEDTGILKHVVDSGGKLFKTSTLKLVYEPRSKAIDELSHIYHRAPRFYDYYFKPGNHFFLPILAFYILIIPIILLIIIYPLLLFLALLILAIVGFMISQSIKEWPKICAGILLVSLFFGLGLVLMLIINSLTGFNKE